MEKLIKKTQVAEKDLDYQLKQVEAAGARFASKRDIVKSHEQLIKNLSDQIRYNTAKGLDKNNVIESKEKVMALKTL